MRTNHLAAAAVLSLASAALTAVCVRSWNF